MKIRTVGTLQELKSQLGLDHDGLLLETDLDVVETDCDWFERKRRDAEVVCTLAANLSGACLEIGTSYGRSAFNIGTNLENRGTIYTVNLLPEQHDDSGGKLVTHLLPKEEIGIFYRSRGLKNVVQLYANTARWDMPAELDQLALVFVDGAHDTELVYSDSKLVYERTREGGYILWHDFSPELRRKHDWIDAAMSGVERFLADYGLEREEILHLRDSWIGVLRKPIRRVASAATTRSSNAQASNAKLEAPARKLRILLGYGAYVDDESVRDRYEAWLARLRGAGINVTGTCLTLNPPGPCLTWPELDSRWKRRDPELLQLYDRLGQAALNYDVFVNYNGINLHPDFVRQLPTFNVFSCFDDPENSENLSRPVASSYDLCLVGNIAEVETYRKWGVANARFWPLGFHATDADPKMSRERILAEERAIDLALVCERRSPWRQERLDKLSRAFPRGTFYGPGWPNGYLGKRETIELYLRTKVGVNLHNSSGPINFRTYELPANGVLQICDNKSYLSGVFELNKEVIGYETMEEAIELCRYYLEHEEDRRRIAAAGWERAVRDYNEVAVFKRLELSVNELISARQPSAQVAPRVEAFQPHKTEWNQEKVGRFWDYMSSSFVGKEEYFSRQVGQGITNFLLNVCPQALEGNVLDFGCGPGYLLEPLSKVAGRIWGADSSADSLKLAGERMCHNPRWGGTIGTTDRRNSLPGGGFDLITCVETIEHLLEDTLGSTLGELRGLLRRDCGLLLITTPFEEKLEMSEVFCPDCGASFHRWQHLRRFTIASLSSLIEKHGFATRLCANLNFSDFQSGRLSGPSTRLPPPQLASLMGRGPHLIWLGNAV